MLMDLSNRQIGRYFLDPELVAKKMIFLSGPRQVGKTTFVRKFIESGNGAYYNWDARKVRSAYKADSEFFLKDGLPDFVVFDEIHKINLWKNILKGIYDTTDKRVRFIVTGSARLDYFRKSGDSLVGRYISFRLLPLSVSELLERSFKETLFTAESHWKDADKALLEILDNTDFSKKALEAYESLKHYSGFPEPFFQNNDRFLRRWNEDYIDLLVREDLRDLTRIRELDTVEKVMRLMPARVGSALSLASLARDVESSFPTVKNHVEQLKKLWLLFSIKSWSKNLNRTVRKEEKVYFLNWTYCTDPGARFENFIAVMLFRACCVWNDLGFGKADLWFVRNFDQNEIDFLVTINGKPNFLVETKLTDTAISLPARNMRARFGVPLIQVVDKPGVFKKWSKEEWTVSADRLLNILP